MNTLTHYSKFKFKNFQKSLILLQINDLFEQIYFNKNEQIGAFKVTDNENDNNFSMLTDYFPKPK